MKNEASELKDDNKRLYTEKDFEEYKKQTDELLVKKEEELKNKIEKELKKSTMSELELAKEELNELREKYKQKEDECLISNQKEETIKILNDKNLDSSILNLVYIPLDMKGTEERIEILKSYTEKIKEDIYKNLTNAPLPLISKEQTKNDAFIEGFETNKL